MSTSPEWAVPIGPARDAGGALNEDLYCLRCGYNLRGLCGDPIRCPECGDFNELGTMRLPAAAIRSALRDMETAPTACVACALLFHTFALLLVVGGRTTVIASIIMVCSVCG